MVSDGTHPGHPQTALLEILIPSSYYDLIFGGARRINKYEDAAFELGEFLEKWIMEKMGAHFDLTIQVLQYPWQDLNHFYEIIDQEGYREKFDWIIVMGTFPIGSWMGFFDRNKVAYGYFQKVRWWRRGWNKAATWSISHELLHLVLKLLGRHTSTWISDVHRNDSRGYKDYWTKEGVRLVLQENQREARYLTVGGDYDE